MKERPILFSGPMVRAILSGQKTQTRRVVKDRHIDAAPTAGQAAAKPCGPVELITEREMAIREARKSARLMLTEEGHEVVCIEPQLWEAICYRAAGQAAAKGAAAVDKDSDGWIKWHGGECPVPDDTLVEVKFECGDSNRFLHAARWDWSHGDDTGYDIVSYRVLAAAPEALDKLSQSSKTFGGDGEALVEKDADGWTKWEGGYCPVPEGTLVDVRYRDGQEQFNLPADEINPGKRDASCAFWINDAQDNDIIAYRVIAAAPEVK